MKQNIGRFSNLNVWAIQYDLEKLYVALNKITNGTSIIYRNCDSFFKLGHKVLNSRQFDTVLYNEDDDILIMLMRGGIANSFDIISYLDNRHKSYSIISFDEKELDIDKIGLVSDKIPELYFARERKGLERAVNDSLSLGNRSCVFYPNVVGKFNLGYVLLDGRQICFDGRKIQGVVCLDDKMVLLINQENNVDVNGRCRNITSYDVYNVMDKRNVDMSIFYGSDISCSNLKRKMKVRG